VDRAVDDVIELIKKADKFLKDRKVPNDEHRRLLHFPRLHVGYAAYRVLASSDRVPKKVDDWLRNQDELIQSRSAGFALRGLHEFAGGKFATAAKRFDEFLNETPDHIKVEETNRALPDGAVLHEGKYTPAIDDRLNAALRGEIAWFFAAAPSPPAKPDKARELLAQLAGRSLPRQALRAEAELLAREDRWDDALAALPRAEQRAPRLMLEELGRQREAYENRRPYTLSRKR
jgi:tetratricopeptide (TPR) repeat protein